MPALAVAYIIVIFVFWLAGCWDKNKKPTEKGLEVFLMIAESLFVVTYYYKILNHVVLVVLLFLAAGFEIILAKDFFVRNGIKDYPNIPPTPRSLRIAVILTVVLNAPAFGLGIMALLN